MHPKKVGLCRALLNTTVDDVELMDLIKKFVQIKGFEMVKIIYLESHQDATVFRNYQTVFTNKVLSINDVYPDSFNLNGITRPIGAIEYIFS